MHPKISVIIPVYNTVSYLKQCLDSIRNQTFRNVEILCIDDGSTDGSLELLREIARTDNRMTILQQNNAGAGAARNLGLSRARGEFLFFLDSDDFFELDYFEQMLLKAEANESDIVVARMDRYLEEEGVFQAANWSVNAKIIPDPEKFRASELGVDSLFCVNGWPWDKMFRRSFVESNNLSFFESYAYNDLRFTYLAWVLAEKVSFLDHVMAHYRIREGSTTLKRNDRWWAAYDAMVDLRDELVSRNLFDDYRWSFINRALRCFWWTYRQVSGPSKLYVHEALRASWFRELGLVGYPREQYLFSSEYDWMIDVLTTPYIKTKREELLTLEKELEKINRAIQDEQAKSRRITQSRAYRVGCFIMRKSRDFR